MSSERADSHIRMADRHEEVAIGVLMSILFCGDCLENTIAKAQSSDKLESAGILPQTRLAGASGPDAGNDDQLNRDFEALATSAKKTGKHMERLPTGELYMRAGMEIDADGAPDARKIDPHGSRQTTLAYQDGSFVNAHKVPYFVLPASKYQQYGIQPGDIAAVRYNGKVRFAVFADEGPSYKFGEGSMALAEALGIDSDPKTGGVAKGVEYIVFPCSGDGTPGTPEGNDRIGTQLLKHQSELMAKLRMQGGNA